MAMQIDVVVVVINKWYESPTFIPFVGMLVGSCFKADHAVVRAAPPDCIAGL